MDLRNRRLSRVASNAFRTTDPCLAPSALMISLLVWVVIKLYDKQTTALGRNRKTMEKTGCQEDHFRPRVGPERARTPENRSIVTPYMLTTTDCGSDDAICNGARDVEFHQVRRESMSSWPIVEEIN